MKTIGEQIRESGKRKEEIAFKMGRCIAHINNYADKEKFKSVVDNENFEKIMRGEK